MVRTIYSLRKRQRPSGHLRKVLENLADSLSLLPFWIAWVCLYRHSPGPP
jgi:hypothetical protein